MFPSLVIFHPDLYESLISTLLNQVFFFFNTSHIFSSKYLPEFLLSNFKSFIPSSNFISCYNNYTISCDSILKKNLKFLPRFFPSNVSQYHPLQKIIINWNKKRKFDNPFEMSGHILLDIFHKLKNKVTPIIFVDKSPLSSSPQIFFHKPRRFAWRKLGRQISTVTFKLDQLDELVPFTVRDLHFGNVTRKVSSFRFDPALIFNRTRQSASALQISQATEGDGPPTTIYKTWLITPRWRQRRETS